MADSRDTEIAWKLFQFIAEKDYMSVGSKADIVATFKECLEAVREKSDEWGDIASIPLNLDA